ncbi:hypothetical protein [Streptosporangium sp. NPDC001681]|uniref:hypothetical protein n=1 Tax=Streptosporangium sp. NPDC001681 TaxID=3154395 RepID=UPI00331FE7C4
MTRGRRRLAGGFVHQFRPQLFATDDRTSDLVWSMFASSDRTWSSHERVPLTSANTLPSSMPTT